MLHNVMIQSRLDVFSPGQVNAGQLDRLSVSPVWLVDYLIVVPFYCQSAQIINATCCGTYLRMALEGVVRLNEFALLDIQQSTPMLSQPEELNPPLLPLRCDTHFEMITVS